MSKHTKGPWKVFQWRDGCQDGSGLYNVGSEEMEVAIVKNILLEDAQLIAAAPELLEALKAAEWGGHENYRQCPVCGGPVHGSDHTPDCILSAALKKAEGGS